MSFFLFSSKRFNSKQINSSAIAAKRRRVGKVLSRHSALHYAEPLESRAMLAAAIMQVTSSTPNGFYRVGDTIAIAVEYDSAVTVSGIPILKLNCNSGGTFASYRGQSGGNTILNFQYTVVSGDTTSPDLDVF